MPCFFRLGRIYFKFKEETWCLTVVLEVGEVIFGADGGQLTSVALANDFGVVPIQLVLDLAESLRHRAGNDVKAEGNLALGF